MMAHSGHVRRDEEVEEEVAGVGYIDAHLGHASSSSASPVPEVKRQVRGPVFAIDDVE